MKERTDNGQIIMPHSHSGAALFAKRMAFRMRLHKGFETEYKKRHDELWPDLKELLKLKGISQYSIFLDETTNILFGVLNIVDPEALNELHTEPVMQRWWHSMKDMMETNDNNSPVSILLQEVFYLP